VIAWGDDGDWLDKLTETLGTDSIPIALKAIANELIVTNVVVTEV
jgi:hypothetical protein